MEAGAAARLIPIRAGEIDDFAVDVEPETENDDSDTIGQGVVASEKVLLRPSRGDARDRFIQLENGKIFDNTPPEGGGWVPVTLIEDEMARDCCGGATETRLQPVRFAPQFFMGNELPILMEALAPPLDQPGLPMGGRRAISFSDSRQGTARLAAKLQQDAERMLTRAFLYHAVQEDHGPKGEERTRLEVNLEKYRRNPDDWPDEIRDLENILTGSARPVPWNELVDRLAQHAELLSFATGVWRERTRGGREMAEDPAKLAETFCTGSWTVAQKCKAIPKQWDCSGLPFHLWKSGHAGSLPNHYLRQALEPMAGLGLHSLPWTSCSEAIERLISARNGWCAGWSLEEDDHARSAGPALNLTIVRPSSRPWPGPIPMPGNPSRLHRLVYALVGDDWDNRLDQDKAGEVLTALWDLITTTIAHDVGGGAYRLDFRKAAISRNLETAWICPVTRRIFGYSPAGRSPYDPTRLLVPVCLPRLPVANKGGLDPDQRAVIRAWCDTDPEIQTLRSQGLWDELHDRAAEYAQFLRAQEHSAQIERPILQIYEEQFKEGRINILDWYDHHGNGG